MMGTGINPTGSFAGAGADHEAVAARIEAIAVEIGFEAVAHMPADLLVPRQEVRDMCAANRCGEYNRSWCCPPACGSLEDNIADMRRHKVAVLVQSIGQLEDSFDYEGIERCSALQTRRFIDFARAVRAEYPVDMLFMGAGGCKLCSECAYPDAPCRHPEDAHPAVEACGIVVTEACKAAGIKYNNGPATITFTGMVLF